MSGDEPLSPDDTIIYWIVSCALVCVAGVVSGLNLALFSIDPIYLRVLNKTGTTKQRSVTRRLLPLLDQQHLILVALLVSNASLATALPLFLERLLSPITSLIVSVTAVLFFGEVIPQATFVRKAMPVCSFLSPFVWLLVGLTFPVSYPVSKLLDKIIGHKVEAMEKDQLGAFFTLHEDHPNAEDQLLGTEVDVMRGAMVLSTKKVGVVLKTRDTDIFTLASDQPLDKETIERILLAGHSRIPVHQSGNQRHILGVLIVKSLLALAFKNPSQPPKAGEYHLREALRVSEESGLYDVYESFQQGSSNMAIVYNSGGCMIGLLTLEDVFEVMHNANFVDEMDLMGEKPIQIEVRQRELMEVLREVKVEQQQLLQAPPSAGGTRAMSGYQLRS